MIGRALTFIRFSHTVFAMPFALGAMLVAASGLPSPRIFGMVVLAMVFARTSAMTFNRLADWELDKRNPRTAGRHKLVSKPVAVGMLLASSAAFIVTTWGINSLCFFLSPVALLIVFFYSLTKRFTASAQFFLGLALAVAPVGAWLAVTGSFALPPLVLPFPLQQLAIVGDASPRAGRVRSMRRLKPPPVACLVHRDAEAHTLLSCLGCPCANHVPMRSHRRCIPWLVL